jgi:hypothetical protein
VREILAEVGEAFSDADRVAAGVPHAGRHDEGVGCVLVERHVGAEAQLAGLGAPYELVDAHGSRPLEANVAGVEALVFARKDFHVPRKRITQAHQEDRLARDARGIDVAVEGNRDPRTRVEPIELVQDSDVLAFRRLGGAVHRHREIYPPGGVLLVIRDCEAIRGEWAALRRTEVKEGMNGAGRSGGDRVERRSAHTASRNQRQSAKATHT